jgi:hypothetical protein
MDYLVHNIQYDAYNDSDLPETITIEVDNYLSPEDKIEYISDKISEITGFCHFCFNTTPEIKE